MDELDYGDLFKTTSKRAIRGQNPVILLVGALVLTVGCFVSFGILAGPLAFGLAGAALKMAREEEVSFSDLWTGRFKFLQALLLFLLIAVAFGVGILAFVVPGAFVLFLSTFAFFVMVDNPDDNAIEVVKKTYSFLKAHITPVLVIAGLEIVLMAILGTGGGFRTVGAVIVIAFMVILDAVLYVRLKQTTEQKSQG